MSHAAGAEKFLAEVVRQAKKGQRLFLWIGDDLHKIRAPFRQACTADAHPLPAQIDLPHEAEKASNGHGKWRNGHGKWPNGRGKWRNDHGAARPLFTARASLKKRTRNDASAAEKRRPKERAGCPTPCQTVSGLRAEGGRDPALENRHDRRKGFILFAAPSV